jgi:cystathionine gamma-synthase
MTGFSTRAIKAATTAPRVDQQPNSVPIYQAVSFSSDDVDELGDVTSGRRPGYAYSRITNPTDSALEAAVAEIHGAEDAEVFASGMAAIHAALATFVSAGDRIVCTRAVYGSTRSQLTNVLSRLGVSVTFVDVTDHVAVDEALAAHPTRILHVETIANPTIILTDIAALATIAHRHGALLVVDNTFASPYLTQPISLGADVVVHSTTKYMGGHSDVVGGAVILADDAVAEAVAFHQNAIGAVAGPMDAWLVLRGIKTLGVRMDRHSTNAARIVDVLTAHSRVTQVLYPGLPDHPGHEIASKQMRSFGGMVSFRVAGGQAQAVEICNRTQLFILGESLGGVESLIEHPGLMTHASVAGSPLEVPADLVRLSVGIESVDDLVDDLVQALG